MKQTILSLLGLVAFLTLPAAANAQATCSATDTAVTAPGPGDAAVLAGDCAALLGVMDTLRGTGALNWAKTLSMASWDGVTLSSDKNGVTTLQLANRSLTGSIPDLSALTNLTRLQLNDNELTGSIVAAYFPPSLETLGLYRNELTGTIPDLSAFTNFMDLTLHDNTLTGSIPDLSALTNLTQLNLSDNALTGSIVAAHFPASLVNLFLRRNELTGSIPDLSALTSLVNLWLDGNELTGSIPDLSALTSLRKLWLHRNALTGSIPTTLAGVTTLDGLHLAWNRLTGGIPAELDGLTSLGYISLCGNDFDLAATLPAALETRRSGGLLALRSCLGIADAEGPEGTTLSFGLTHSTWPVRGGDSLTLGYETGDGTATSGDYTGAMGSVTVPAIGTMETAATAEIQVVALADSLVEDEETFTVTVSVPSGRGVLALRLTAEGTIREPAPDPGPPPGGGPPDGGTVNGRTVTLRFAQRLDESSVPDPGDFTVTSTSSSAASASSGPNEPASVAAAQTVNHRVTAVRIQGASAVLRVSRRFPAGASVRVSYTEGATPLRTEAGTEIDNFSYMASAPPDPEPEVCELHVTPYWEGTGGFVARPTDGRSARVTIACGRWRSSNTLYAGDDGLIVQLLRRSFCREDDGSPVRGMVTFEGIEDGGWYWIHGDRNAGVAPLVCEDRLDGPVATVPGGVEAQVSDTGTLFQHEASRLIGIVPHLDATRCEGRHETPYFRGRGGFVGRPLNGESARVRVQCGRTYSTSRRYANEDGLIVELLQARYCFDGDGEPKRGTITVDGLEDGAWYWVDGERNAAAATFVCQDDEGGTPAVVPGGVDADVTDTGTLFLHHTANLIGVVPHLEEKNDG